MAAPRDEGRRSVFRTRSVGGVDLDQPAASEDRFRRVFDAAAIGMALVDPTGRFLLVNASMGRALGRTPRELERLSIADVGDKETAKELSGALRDSLLADPPSLQLEAGFEKPDGTRIRAVVTATLVREAAPSLEPLYFFVQLDDVTERRLAEERLAASEARYRGLIEHLPLITYASLPDELGTTVEISSQVEESLGYPVEAWLANPRLWLEVVHPDDRDRVRRQTLLQNERGERARMEYRAIARDGRVVWLLDDSVVERDDAGAPCLVRGCATDITHLKEIARDLAEAEDRYRRLVEEIPLVHYLDRADLAGSSLYISPQVERLLGYPPADWYGNQGLFGQILHPDDRDRALDDLERFLHGDGPMDAEYRLIARDGRVVWVRDVAVVERDDEGAPVRVRGYWLDITAQRAAEEALRGSEAMNRRILASANEGIVALDREHRYTVWNPYMERLRGVAAADVLGRTPEEALPDLAGSELTELIDRALAGETIDVPDVQSFPQPDGPPRLGRITIAPLRDDHARIVGVLATVRDVTDEVTATEAVHRRDMILEAVSAAGQLLLEQPLASCEGEILSMLGRAIGASRVQLWEYSAPDGMVVATQRSEWCALGVPADAWPSVAMEPEGFGRWLEEFRAGRAVHGPTRLLPERALVERSGILSICEVPIFVDGTLWGELGFDDCRAEREWAPTELDALRLAAGIVGAAIGRARADEALRRSEELLRQSQKLEAIGRLAGGVAHDFNNLLTVITGYGGLLLDQLPADSPLRPDIDQIADAADRAVALTGQLLAFSRRQMLQPRTVDLNATVAETQLMLARLIGEDIELESILAPGSAPVHIDPGQLQQVLVNLAVNARDAMPTGGRLTIETRTVELAAAPAEAPELAPGSYVVLSVSDTGHGMDEETRGHVFEPFFTTKETGKGTGLGLATVYGIVMQSGGAITVASAPGEGTTFAVYLPALGVPPAGIDVPAGAAEAPGGSETLLLAEDEDVVRTLIVTVLQQRGYRVIAARDGAEALELSERHADEIDMLLTDVVMPRVGGRQLAERLHAIRPTLPVLYISGYTDDAFNGRGATDPDVPLLQKPFTAGRLAAAVRGVLDSGTIEA